MANVKVGLSYLVDMFCLRLVLRNALRSMRVLAKTYIPTWVYSCLSERRGY